MAFKLGCQVGWLSLCLLSTLPVYAQENPFGQTFQINTHLDSYVGKPTWVLIITDVDTGQVSPYLFNIVQDDNFWVHFTFAHRYRITSSELHFGPPDATIYNFCHLQDGILDRESVVVTLSGKLTPKRSTAECHFSKYKEYSFPIAPPEDTSTETSSEAPTTPEEAAENPTAALTTAAPALANLAPALSALAPLAKLAK